jgi:NitT/TauT family transport system permease protein
MSAATRESLLSAAQLVLVLLVGWQLLYWSVGEVALRSPVETIRFTLKLMATDTFWGHLAETAKAFGIALVLAIVAGLALGFLLGLNRFASEVLEPLLIAFYSIPKITLYPILLLICGLGIAAKIAFGFIHGIIPVALFTIAAVHNVRPVFRKTARVMGLGTMETILKVLVPAALPEIFAGLRIGFALTLIGTLLGEMFASQRGLGFLLMSAIGLHNIDLIMALTFLLTLFAGTASGLLLFVNRRLEARRG